MDLTPAAKRAFQTQSYGPAPTIDGVYQGLVIGIGADSQDAQRATDNSNTLVDALNLCSLRYQLPFGLYDLARVRPPVVLRKGRAGESYEGIRKGPVNVQDRPTLADEEGAFGNPTSDSARTMITLQTTSTLVTCYAPALYSVTRLRQVLDGTEQALRRACGGTLVELQVLPATGGA